MRTALFLSFAFFSIGASSQNRIAPTKLDTTIIIETIQRGLESIDLTKQDSLLLLASRQSAAINRKDYQIRITQLLSFIHLQMGQVTSATQLAQRAVAIGLKDTTQNKATTRDAITNLALCYNYTDKRDSNQYWIDLGKRLCRNRDTFNLSVLTSLDAINGVKEKRRVEMLFDSAILLAKKTEDLNDDVMASFNKASWVQANKRSGWAESIEMLTAFGKRLDHPSLLNRGFKPYERLGFHYRNSKNTMYALLCLNYLCLFEFDNAFYYQKRVAENYRNDKNRYLPYILFDLSEVDILRDSIQQARLYYDSAVRLITNQFHRKSIPHASFYFTTGWFCESKKQFSSAISNYRKSLFVTDLYFPKVSIPALLRTMVAAHRWVQADSLVHAMNATIRGNDFPVETFVRILYYKELANYYKVIGDTLLSTRYLVKHYRLKDSLTTVARYHIVKEVETRFKTLEKEEELSRAKMEGELQAHELNQKKSLIGYLVGGLVLFGILSIALFKNYRAKTRQAKELLIRNTKIETLIRELHHRVKNNMQTISSLLSLQSVRTADKNARAALQEGQKRVEAMGLIHQKLYLNDDLRGVNMEEFLSALIQTLAQSYGFDPAVVKKNINFPEQNLDVDLAIPLGLIINELIINAFKHAFGSVKNPELHVALTERKNKQLELLVRDNGIGLPEQTQRDLNAGSFGLKLVQTLSKQLKGTLSITNEGGAIFQLIISM